MKRIMVSCVAALAMLVSAATLTAEQKIKLNFWALSDQKDFLEPILADFEKANPNVNVELTVYATDAIKQSLKVAASSKTLPNVWFSWGGTLGSFYAENGMTADLNKVAKDRGWSSKYNKAALDLSTYNGKLSGVPYHLNVMGVYYPKDLLAKYKIATPKTFADFEANLKTLKAAKVTPLAFAGKNGWHLMRLTEVLLEHYAGPKRHDELNALKASWKDPAVVQTFAKLKEWSDAGYFPKGFISLDPQEVETNFYSGTMAYNIEGSWWDGNMNMNEFDPSSQDFFTFPTDQNPVRTSSFVEMFQVSAQNNPEQMDASIKLVEFMTSVPTVSKYLDTYGASATLGIPTSPKSPHVKPMADEAAKGNFLIGDQALPQEIAQKLFEATDKVVLKVWTPDQAAAAIQTAVDAFKKK